MSEQEAAVAIRRFALLLKGLVELEPELSSLASVKQAAAEASARVVQMQKDEEAAKVSLCQVLDAVESAKAAAKKTLADAEGKAEQINKIADRRDKENHEKTRQTLTILEEGTNKRLQQANSKIKLAEERLELLGNEIAEGEKRYSTIQKRIDEVIKSATKGLYDGK